ncbi:MAG: EamA family transporter [Ahrensia sp.]|nr:EamA family transporter [Ahrensia sp.]
MAYLPFILFTVLTNAAAQMMLKQGMLTLGPVTGDGPVTAASLAMMVVKVVFHPWVFFGLVTFVISMASHLYVLSRVELSFAYPFLSLAYVAVAVAAWILFGEDLNAWRVAGIALICLGALLIAHSGHGVEVGRNDVAGLAKHPVPPLNQIRESTAK